MSTAGKHFRSGSGIQQSDSRCPGWMCNVGLSLLSPEIPHESKCLAANRQLCSSSRGCAGNGEFMAAVSVSGFGAGTWSAMTESEFPQILSELFSLRSNSAACSSAVRKPAISLADSTDLRYGLGMGGQHFLGALGG